MKHNFSKSSPPNILGAGLICLDIIKDSNAIYHLNGGSCGNVTAGLSFLGWDTAVITNHYFDIAGKILSANLTNLGTKQIKTGNRLSKTPRIIEEIYIQSGVYTGHKFISTCSECGKKLPSIKNLSRNSAKIISKNIDHFNVFYTDRASPGIHFLRKTFKDKGNWTVYEPNSARNIKSFYNNSLDSHIVKFSSERISFSVADNLRTKAKNAITVLLVYTMGKEGLLFCYRKRNKKMSKWSHLHSQPVPNYVDASGAGDWCTTGIIAWLVGNSRKSKVWLTNNEVISAIQYGQALASISCSFIGGQGLIYANYYDKNSTKLFKDIIKTKTRIKPAPLPKNKINDLCYTCLQHKA